MTNLIKGDIIKKIRSNKNPLCESENYELIYEVVRVNRNTYGLKCIEGFMKGSGCKLVKDFKDKYIDEYGTVTEWIIL